MVNPGCWCRSFGNGVQGCAAVDRSQDKSAIEFRERGGSVALLVRCAGQHAKLAFFWGDGGRLPPPPLSPHSPSGKDMLRDLGVFDPSCASPILLRLSCQDGHFSRALHAECEVGPWRSPGMCLAEHWAFANFVTLSWNSSTALSVSCMCIYTYTYIRYLRIYIYTFTTNTHL